MFSYIRGVLTEKGPDSAIVECNGIGYLLSVPASTLGRLQAVGQEVKLFTYLSVREDGISLYGFISGEEKELFLLLLSVSGVGPKAALSVLSALTPEEFYLAVVREDIKSLTRVPGIGPKSAKRLFVELREKVGTKDLTKQAQDTGHADALSDAMEALLTLGYNAGEAQSALQAVQSRADSELSGRELLRQALARLGSR
ncbi:MAG: Holliday junction branch migration protein RuvA [Dethiobacter sp.]|jgi:Holliday junction DNA helicase RuvA|nr:Holliday junction branch migration protein RuvA [Dethiobacter sp.]